MEKGQPFNISKAFTEVRIPLIMVKDRSLSYATKMVYGLLIKHSGSAGYCSVYQYQLAKELGSHIKLVRKAVARLKMMKYILTIGAGGGLPSRYYFLWRNEFCLRQCTGNSVELDPALHTKIIREAAQKDKAGS